MSNSTLPETCTLMLSLDLTVYKTFNPRTHVGMNTEVTENTALQELLGHYETQTVETDVCLGKGGMGIVLCGQQTLPDREVAIKKVLKPSNTYQRMLLQEAQITGQLEHPNIVPIHQIKRDDNGDILIIMKKVQGKTLMELLPSFHKKETYQIPVEQLQQLMLICHALEYAHSKEIVHRDIKLENIMVGNFNEVFLMDWGLGMHLVNQIGANPGIVGTPSYLAPEMLSGDPENIDVRTDVYLMGATIHHLLMGTPRHDGTKVRETLEQAHASAPIDYPPHIPFIFGNILNKACAQQKSQRYQCVTDLRLALEEALEHWEAIQLTERAEIALVHFKFQLKDQPEDSSTLFRTFLRIRTILESAIEMWKGNTLAKDRLEELLYLMIEYHIGRLEVSSAESLFAEISAPTPALFNRLAVAQTEYKKLSSAHERAQEYDPLQSKSGRKTLIVSLAASSVSLVSFAFAYSFFVSQEVTTLRLMFTGSVVSIACLVGIFVGRKTLLSNKLGAQMAKTFTITSLLATFNHWVGHLNFEAPNAIMAMDMFILAAAFSMVRDSIRSAYKIALMSAVSGCIGVLYPNLSHPLLLATILFSTMWALMDWYREE